MPVRRARVAAALTVSSDARPTARARPQGPVEVPCVPQAVHRDRGHRVRDSHYQAHQVDSGDLPDRRVEEGHQRPSASPHVGRHLSLGVVHGAPSPLRDGDRQLLAPLSGTVEVDEAYIGGKRKGGKGRMPADGGRKAAVAVLVERGGRVKAMPMERMDGESMTAEIKRHVAAGSVLMTDETNIYTGPKVPSGERQIAGMTRHMVNHGTGEYVRGDVTRTRRKASSRC